MSSRGSKGRLRPRKGGCRTNNEKKIGQTFFIPFEHSWHDSPSMIYLL